MLTFFTLKGKRYWGGGWKRSALTTAWQIFQKV